MAKLAIFNSSLHRGGSEREAVNIAGCFLAAGHEVVFVTQHPEEEGEYPLPPGARRVVSERVEPFGSSMGQRIAGFSDRFFRLRRIWKQERPDVILSFIGKNNVMAVITSLGLGIPAAVHVQGEARYEYPEGPERRAAFLAFRFAAGIALQTGRSKNFFPEALRKKCEVLPNILSKEFAEYEGMPRLPLILTAGRMDANKNHAMLIRAFGRISERFPGHTLTILGDGPERENLLSLAKELGVGDRVSLPGSVSDVISYMRKAQVFVLTSDSEGLPNVLLEAMSQALPVISTDTASGGPAEITSDGRYGKLIPVGGEDALVDALLEMLSDPEECRRAGEQAREAVRRFMPDRAEEAWREYLLQFVRAK